MEGIILIGSSGHAGVIIDIIEATGIYSIGGFIDSFEKPGAVKHGITCLGDIKDINEICDNTGINNVVVAIGDNWNRNNISQSLISLRPQLAFPSLIHPSAILSRHIKIGKGVVVMPLVVINKDAHIADFCIVNTKASIDHDCTIGLCSSIAPGATLGGNVSIGQLSAIGIGANVRQKINIGNHSVIGGGAFVQMDIPDHSVAYGVPAKIIRNRTEAEKYL